MTFLQYGLSLVWISCDATRIERGGSPTDATRALIDRLSEGLISVDRARLLRGKFPC
jgi:hypothetical protein